MNPTTNQSATQGKRFMRRTTHEVRMLKRGWWVGGSVFGLGPRQWVWELEGPPTAAQDFIFGFG